MKILMVSAHRRGKGYRLAAPLCHPTLLYTVSNGGDGAQGCGWGWRLWPMGAEPIVDSPNPQDSPRVPFPIPSKVALTPPRKGHSVARLRKEDRGRGWKIQESTPQPDLSPGGEQVQCPHVCHWS